MKLAVCVAVVLACACKRERTDAGPKFELLSVCKERIAALEKELPRAATPAAVDAETRERIRSLVIDAAHGQGRMRALSLQDVASTGASAVTPLEELADDVQRDAQERSAAIEALGAIDAPESADALAKHVDIQVFREPWVRTRAAYELVKQSSDHWIPRLTAQLKYETDGETVIWMALALAKHGNYAGLDGLRVLSARAATPEISVDAAAAYAQAAKEAGFADGEALYAAWYSAAGTRDHAVPIKEPSPRLRLETWKRIAALAEFDLRIVDDARFALVASPPWAVDDLIRALHESDGHIRLHVTQCLARLGARATSACAELVRALDEPHIAASAATALGEIGCADAVDALVARTTLERDPELRAAAAAALGRLGPVGSAKALPCLRALQAPAEPLDLRQTAAQSLLELGEEPDAVALLVECLTRPGADAGAAETALEASLTRAAREGSTTARTRLDAWVKLGAGIEGTPTLQQAAARRKARAALLEGKPLEPAPK